MEEPFKPLGSETPQGAAQQPTPHKNIGMAVVAYLIFFVPLLTESKKDPFVLYHVKQGIVLTVAGVLVWILSNILMWSMPIFFPFAPLLGLVNLGLFVLLIIGIAHALQGEEKPLPLIGSFAASIKL